MGRPRIGSLCTGYGGLDAAVADVLGSELAWVADNDPGAMAILAHRFPSVPNLGDITAAGWAAVEPVDILGAGFPCQPWSDAGRRQGEGDERWIWPAIADGIRALRPGFVFLENVPGLIARGGLSAVTADLAAAGYVGSWCSVRASDVGAPHKRKRVFILAWPPADTFGGELQRRGVAGVVGGPQAGEPSEGRQWQRAGHAAGDSGATAEDPDRAAGGERRLAGPGQTPGGRPRADAGGPGGARTAADPERGRRDGWAPEPQRGPLGGTAPARDSEVALNWRQYAPAIRRWEAILGRPAPRPTEPGRTGERLSPRFVEWLMGLPGGWVTDVPGLSRNAKLKALGNGVVPQQAAYALRLLLAQIGEATHAA